MENKRIDSQNIISSWPNYSRSHISTSSVASVVPIPEFSDFIGKSGFDAFMLFWWILSLVILLIFMHNFPFLQFGWLKNYTSISQLRFKICHESGRIESPFNENPVWINVYILSGFIVSLLQSSNCNPGIALAVSKTGERDQTDGTLEQFWAWHMIRALNHKLKI